MRYIVLLIFISLISIAVNAQEKPPTQKQIQAQMQGVVSQLDNQVIDLEKRLEEAKKNKEDAATIKALEEQLAMLKKQLQLIGGIKKGLSEIPDKTFKKAVEKEPLVPKKDVARIQTIPDNIFSDTLLYAYLKRAHAEVEKLIAAEEKAEAAKIYRDVKTDLKLTSGVNNAAAACWIYGHWEKALWLSGKACLDDMSDPDDLNNYAAYLTMIGGEHVAVPILRYLNKKYPENSTVLNNLGQAWFGLGDIPAAEKFLRGAAALSPDHSTANLTLSNIYLARGDSGDAILALKRSFKSYFTTAKASRLENLGYELDDDDIAFDYPMEDEDPFGYEPFFSEFPPTPGNVNETPMMVMQWEAFHEATENLHESAQAEADVAVEKSKLFAKNLANPAFNQPVLKLHNSNAYVKAGRKFLLATRKKTALSIEEVMSMMAEAYHQATTSRLNALDQQRRRAIAQAPDCNAIDAANNAFMQEAKAIIDDGSAAMRQVYQQNKKKVHEYIKLTAYSSITDYNEKMGKFHQELWKKNSWIYVYTANFTSAYRNLKQAPQMPSSCKTTPEVPKQIKQLPSLKKPECNYTDSTKLVVGTIKEECNTCTIDESKLKFRQTNTQQGEVQVSEATNSTAQGPQKQESVSPAQTTNIRCNQSVPIRSDRTRPRKSDRCTVNSDRSSPGISGSMGGRLLR